MKKDYMVTTDDTIERIYGTLAEAKKDAKKLSNEFGYAKINRWIFQNGDMVFDEEFEIVFEKGEIE